jgi:hypothetical protein
MGQTGLKGLMEDNSSGDEMSEVKPVRCQKCGKPLGYITVLGKGLISHQRIQNVKIVAVCMECFQKKK